MPAIDDVMDALSAQNRRGRQAKTSRVQQACSLCNGTGRVRLDTEAAWDPRAPSEPCWGCRTFDPAHPQQREFYFQVVERKQLAAEPPAAPPKPPPSTPEEVALEELGWR